MGLFGKSKKRQAQSREIPLGYLDQLVCNPNLTREDCLGILDEIQRGLIIGSPSRVTELVAKCVLILEGVA